MHWVARGHLRATTPLIHGAPSAACQPDLLAAVITERVEEPFQGRRVPPGRGPHQPASVMIDHHGQVAVPLADDMRVIVYLGDRPARLPDQPTKERRWLLFLAW